MARAATTLDPFNAIAEPKRRRVLETLSLHAEWPVNHLAEHLGWPQPMVSKHLGVLKQVGLVTMRQDGQRRLYALDAERIKPVFDWAKNFERFWEHQLDRIKERAERIAREQEQRKPSQGEEP